MRLRLSQRRLSYFTGVLRGFRPGLRAQTRRLQEPLRDSRYIGPRRDHSLDRARSDEQAEFRPRTKEIAETHAAWVSERAQTRRFKMTNPNATLRAPIGDP